MFEFGRDLRKLFAQARESEDLSWLELIGVDLLAVEARQQSTDAGRVSCARPHAAWLRAAGLWREHARRTGASDSLRRALDAAHDAAKHAHHTDDTARAAIETAQILLMRFDLSGGRDVLDQAAEAVPGLASGLRSSTVAATAAIHARIRSRAVRFVEDAGHPHARTQAVTQAMSLLDTALHGLRHRPAFEVDDVRIDRAALALETGVMRRDVHMLDEAGRALSALVETASPDYRPLTRARALTLCGAGLAALAELAHDTAARLQGRAMFEAAAEQFTPDHSPLDWAVVQIVRGSTPGAVSLTTLRQAESLTAGHDLILGALARDMLIEGEVALAASIGDLPRLSDIEAATRQRLKTRPTDRTSELDWAVDQIAMARIAAARARLTGSDATQAGLALFDAMDVARERGVPGLAGRAGALIEASLVKA